MKKPPFKLPIRAEHIPYEGTWFYDADGDDVEHEAIAEFINTLNTSEAGRSSSGGAPAEGTARNSLGDGTAPARAFFCKAKEGERACAYQCDECVDDPAAFCPVSEAGCQEKPICPWPCKRLER